MPIHDGARWSAIESFRFDEGAPAYGFAHRLAEEQGWTPAFTERVLHEYRRFLYLAATSDQPVTPSKAVDETWHLHLTYTRSYWERLCPAVLGRPLHHEPTRGGIDEAGRFEKQYRDTLRRYRETFGEPPAAIWPSAPVGSARLARTAKHGLTFAFAVLLISALTILPGCVPAAWHVDVAMVWWFVVISLFVTLILWLVRNGTRGNGGGGGGCGSACGCGGCGS